MKARKYLVLVLQVSISCQYEDGEEMGEFLQNNERSMENRVREYQTIKEDAPMNRSELNGFENISVWWKGNQVTRWSNMEFSILWSEGSKSYNVDLAFGRSRKIRNKSIVEPVRYKY